MQWKVAGTCAAAYFSSNLCVVVTNEERESKRAEILEHLDLLENVIRDLPPGAKGAKKNLRDLERLRNRITPKTK
jgi:hypothetical protein